MTLDEIRSLVAEHLNRTDLGGFCGLAEGTNSATLQTANLIYYSIYGNQYSKSATNNIAMTALGVQAISTYCLYLVQINAAGTVSIKKGTEVATDTSVLPTVTAGNVAIGAFKIATNASTTFTSGTTDLSAAGITATFYDIDSRKIDTFINTGIRKLERLINFRHMRVRSSVALAVSSHTVTNPITNYKRLLSVFALGTDGRRYKVERTTYADAIRRYPDLTNDVGHIPTCVAEILTIETTLTPDIAPTAQLIFRPTTTAALSYTIELEAYQYSPSLDGIYYTTNWWTQNAPEIVMYAALCEAEPFIFNDPRIATWKSQLNEAIKSMRDAEIEEKLSGSEQSIESEYVV